MTKGGATHPHPLPKGGGIDEVNDGSDDSGRQAKRDLSEPDGLRGRGLTDATLVRPKTPPGHEVHRVGNQWYLYVIYRRRQADGKEKRRRKYLGNINGARS